MEERKQKREEKRGEIPAKNKEFKQIKKAEKEKEDEKDLCRGSKN